MKRMSMLSKGLLGLGLLFAGASVAYAGSCSSCGAHAAKGGGGASKEKAAYQEKKQDIVDVAVSAGSFNTLVAAVQAAGLVETLKGEGPFTVFAPTDAAFAKLPEGTVADLLKPENKDKLVAILTYHVVPGKVKAKDVVNLTSAKTVQGENLAIKVEEGKVKVNSANVTSTDIKASNGVIHVVDTVLLP